MSERPVTEAVSYADIEEDVEDVGHFPAGIEPTDEDVPGEEDQ